MMIIIIHILCLPNPNVEIGFESRNGIKIVQVGTREYGPEVKKNKPTWCIKMAMTYVYTFGVKNATCEKFLIKLFEAY